MCFWDCVNEWVCEGLLLVRDILNFVVVLGKSLRLMVLKDKRLLEYLKNGRSVSVYFMMNSEMGYVFLYKVYVMESLGK